MATQTTKPFKVLEKTTAVYAAIVEDEDGNGIASGSITTLTLTLYDLDTAGIINSRDGQDVLNANNGTVDGSGNLAFTFQILDNIIVSTTPIGSTEEHIALFEWTYSSGTKSGKHLVQVIVESLEKVS